MCLWTRRVGEPSRLADMAEILHQQVLQIPDDVDRCKARIIADRHVLPKPSTIAAIEWTLNFVGVSPVNMAGLVIYLMDV